MTENTNNPPVETHRDGAVSAKIWRNHTNEGDAFYSVTFQRTYTDPQTEKPRESTSFQGTDLLKIQQLASEAYRSIAHHRALDREEAAADQRNMVAERESAMSSAAPQQRQRAPEQRDRRRGER